MGTALIVSCCVLVIFIILKVYVEHTTKKNKNNLEKDDIKEEEMDEETEETFVKLTVSIQGMPSTSYEKVDWDTLEIDTDAIKFYDKATKKEYCFCGSTLHYIAERDVKEDETVFV